MSDYPVGAANLRLYETVLRLQRKVTDLEEALGMLQRVRLRNAARLSAEYLGAISCSPVGGVKALLRLLTTAQLANLSELLKRVERLTVNEPPLQGECIVSGKALADAIQDDPSFVFGVFATTFAEVFAEDRQQPRNALVAGEISRFAKKM